MHTFNKMRKQNKNRNTSEIISEMRQMLHEPKLTVENMIFSELDNKDFDDMKNSEEYYDEEPNNYNNQKQTVENDTVSINDSINKIRQIALSAIAQLADDPTSPEYDLMKKIWNLCDKKFEVQNGNKRNSNGED